MKRGFKMPSSPGSLWLVTDQHPLSKGSVLSICLAIPVFCEGHGICFWVSHQLFQYHVALNPVLPL